MTAVESNESQPANALSAVERGTARLSALFGCEPFDLVVPDALRAAADLEALAEKLLRETVAETRRHGATWNDVGAALGISRQAAFQRFGAASERPATVEPSKAVALDPVGSAEALFACWAARDWSAVRERFAPSMLEAVAVQALEKVWNQVHDAVGAYRAPGEAGVRRNGVLRIVDLALLFDDGEMAGRVAFDRDGKVSGMLILEPTMMPSRS